jgi:CRP-like cAMP-binding protein
MSAILSVPFDPLAAFGRRPSGARLYHSGSRFGEPQRRKLGREQIARILFLAEAFDRRTRQKGQHGGTLKGKGLDVLRALLRQFYCKATGECYPSYDTIAEAAGCCRETVRQKLKALELLGIIEIIRRKVARSNGTLRIYA